MTFLGITKFNLQWNSVLEAFLFKMEIKAVYLEEALTVYYSIFILCGAYFLKLFGSDLGLSLLILLKSPACFSSIK